MNLDPGSFPVLSTNRQRQVSISESINRQYCVAPLAVRSRAGSAGVCDAWSPHELSAFSADDSRHAGRAGPSLQGLIH